MRPLHETNSIAGPGDTAPSFTLLPYRSTRSVTWQPGKVTVLSFCALWCDTWREQSARLASVRQRLAGLPVDYLTISVDGRWAERFAGGTPADSGVLLDTGGSISAQFGLKAIPWTVIVDASGTIQWTRQGIVRTEELELVLRRFATQSAPSGIGTLYLTFDDFPTLPLSGSVASPDEELLDILRRADIRATFFCIGEHLLPSSGAALARRAVQEGHRLQLHSWGHDARRPDLARCVDILRRVTGVDPTLYRPPGSSELRLADGVTPATPYRATIAPYDQQRPGVAELMRRVLFAIRPNTIIQLHAGVSDTRIALPALIAAMRRQGGGFGVL